MGMRRFSAAVRAARELEGSFSIVASSVTSIFIKCLRLPNRAISFFINEGRFICFSELDLESDLVIVFLVAGPFGGFAADMAALGFLSMLEALDADAREEVALLS